MSVKLTKNAPTVGLYLVTNGTLFHPESFDKKQDAKTARNELNASLTEREREIEPWHVTKNGEHPYFQ